LVSAGSPIMRSAGIDLSQGLLCRVVKRWS
jgi:hypothetical protein